jgi:hypothetical protein
MFAKDGLKPLNLYSIYMYLSVRHNQDHNYKSLHLLSVENYGRGHI